MGIDSKADKTKCFFYFHNASSRQWLSRITILLFSACLLLTDCKKKDPENPYSELKSSNTSVTQTIDSLPEGSFGWLHQKIFKPTCANSGCHDGTFEPDFRTISSSYNSLVNQPVISNSPDSSFQYRVVPGNVNSSWLHERMNVFVDNTSGIMPLSLEPNSDWPTKSAYYIQKVNDWIAGGAKDMFGNPAPPAGVNAPPVVYGLAVFPHNNTTDPYLRDPNPTFGIGEILVPSALVDVYILPFDDNAFLTGFNSVKLKVGSNYTGFSNLPEVNCTLLTTPISTLDFGNSTNTFYYKATIDLSGIPSGSSRFLRCYVDDGVQTNITEVPNDNSAFFWYLLFALKIQ